MKKNDYRPGEVIVTDFLGYQHWSIVSDRKCDDNQYKLISATRRNGTVKEEKFDTVTQGRHSYKVGDIGKPEDFLFLIDRARGWIGQWDYSILSANCEHFVNLIRLDKAKSRQLENTLLCSAITLMLVSASSKKISVSSMLCLLVISGGIAVYASRGQPAASNSLNHNEGNIG